MPDTPPRPIPDASAPDGSKVSNFGHGAPKAKNGVRISKPLLFLVFFVTIPAAFLYFYLYNPLSLFINWHQDLWLIGPAFWFAAVFIGYTFRIVEEKNEYYTIGEPEGRND